MRTSSSTSLMPAVEAEDGRHITPIKSMTSASKRFISLVYPRRRDSKKNLCRPTAMPRLALKADGTSRIYLAQNKPYHNITCEHGFVKYSPYRPSQTG